MILIAWRNVIISWRNFEVSWRDAKIPWRDVKIPWRNVRIPWRNVNIARRNSTKGDVQHGATTQGRPYGSIGSPGCAAFHRATISASLLPMLSALSHLPRKPVLTRLSRSGLTRTVMSIEPSFLPIGR